METLVLQVNDKKKLKLFTQLASSLNITYRLTSSVSDLRNLIYSVPNSEITIDEIKNEIKAVRKQKNASK
jgi:hypothetical protein